MVKETIVSSARIRERGGIKYPSVTSILQLAPQNPNWEQYQAMIGTEEAMKIMLKAADRGNIVHEYVQDYYTDVQKTYDVNLYVSPDDTPEQRIKSIKKIQGFYNAMGQFLASRGNALDVLPENVEKELYFTVHQRKGLPCLR